MNRTTIAATAIALAAITTPAQADTNYLEHSNDDGYNPSIVIRCSAGYNTSVAENRTAGRGFDICNNPVSRVYIRAGEELRCLRVDYYGDTYWDKSWDAAGWHDVPDGWTDGRGCALWKD